MKYLLWIFVLSAPLVFQHATDSIAENSGQPAKDQLSQEYQSKVRPLLVKYCQACHSTKEKEGELDLQRFTSLQKIRADVKPWQLMIEQLQSGEMPPKKKPQPTAKERKNLIDWTRRFLNSEARARAGDPGRVPLRRLSNAEYNNTIRDLIGVDLQPAKDFPADGAAGEGFTNAAEALNMSPAMMSKYLDAAKKISSHVVLLPDGFRFSEKNTRRDWTDESLVKIRQFYHQFTKDGRIPLQLYITALVRNRSDLHSGKTTMQAVARKEKLSEKYLSVLWQALNSKKSSFPLDRIRQRWQNATEKDVAAMVTEVNSWRDPLWKFVKVGSYRYGNTVRAVAKNPAISSRQSFRMASKTVPGQSDVTLYLLALKQKGNQSGYAVWHRPRLEMPGKPALLLSEYAKFGSNYEVDYSKLFAKTSDYLAAVLQLASDRKLKIGDVAVKRDLNEKWLQRWVEVLALNLSDSSSGRSVPPVELTLLNKKTTKVGKHAGVNGWFSPTARYLSLVSNASNTTRNIPGRVSPHKVTVHPTPTQFVAAVWKSPITGKVRIDAKISHAHDACGNGVAWWIEKKLAKRSAILAQGTVDRGKEGTAKPITIEMKQGEQLFLAIEARDSSHICDLTEIKFTLSEQSKPNRKWDLASDVADNVLQGNPHADRLENKDVWSFVHGPIKKRPMITGFGVPQGSILSKWRIAATQYAKEPSNRKTVVQKNLEKMAQQVQALLTGKRPADKNQTDHKLYNNLIALNGLLLDGFNPSKLTNNETSRNSKYGFKGLKFGVHPSGRQIAKDDLVVPLNKVIPLHLPAALFHRHQFMVEGILSADSKNSVVQFQVLKTLPKNSSTLWNAKQPVVTVGGSEAHRKLLSDFDEFRRLFPPYICYPHVIPVDEVVCLKTFHREDEPLIRLFLNEKQTQKINHLWEEHRFITKFPTVENEYLPLFIGFVTQDQPKQLLDYFESRRGWFRKRAEQFEKEFEQAGKKQLQQLFQFTSHAFRRPLRKTEQESLQALYKKLRLKKMPHEKAIRNVISRVFISPSFLLHLENSPSGKKPQKINQWEMASRLSYFLWGTMPDEELRKTAAAGTLFDRKVLEGQVRRMLKDEKVRGLAVEFGTQSIHVRNFDQFNEKNEKLFPTFNAKLRNAMYEESILFFQDLFQNDRPLVHVLDSNATYLNETLAKHYGIPDVVGPKWRRVEGIRKYGRGGILGLASVQSKQAGASRTSPILRGNWVVETLLGERLPRPPANIPQLPEKETGNGGLTMRQLVEKHVSNANCAICHQRIDPYGFAFENYDPIGRQREKDLGGLPVDTQAKLKDGTKFSGIDGLRNYLLTKKETVVLRLFCKRLLGYALARSITLSDEPLLDKMMPSTKKKDERTLNIVLEIVNSKQFQMIRGGDFSDSN